MKSVENETPLTVNNVVIKNSVAIDSSGQTAINGQVTRDAFYAIYALSVVCN